MTWWGESAGLVTRSSCRCQRPSWSYLRRLLLYAPFSSSLIYSGRIWLSWGGTEGPSYLFLRCTSSHQSSDSCTSHSCSCCFFKCDRKLFLRSQSLSGLLHPSEKHLYCRLPSLTILYTGLWCRTKLFTTANPFLISNAISTITQMRKIISHKVFSELRRVFPTPSQSSSWHEMAATIEATFYNRARRFKLGMSFVCCVMKVLLDGHPMWDFSTVAEDQNRPSRWIDRIELMALNWSH